MPLRITSMRKASIYQCKTMNKKSVNHIHNNISNKEKERIGKLLMRSEAIDLEVSLVSVGLDKRKAEAKRKCEERRKKREAKNQLIMSIIKKA